MDLHLSIFNGFVSSKISQLIIFARVCSHIEDFNANKCLLAKLLKQGYRYHKLRKVFFPSSIADTRIDFKIQSLLHQGLSEPEFYSDYVYISKLLWVGLIFLISFEK